MSPFENKTPQELAALHMRGTLFVDFIRERVNSLCIQTGERPKEVWPKVRKEVIADMTEGLLFAIGKNAHSTDEFSLEVIPWTFWPEARSLMADYQFRSDSAHFNEIRILNPKDAGIDQAPRRLHDPTAKEKKPPGRPSSRKEVDRLLRDLKQDPKFRGLPNSEAQACEVRARLLGEEYRYRRDMKGYKDESLKRWIGEALTTGGRKSSSE